MANSITQAPTGLLDLNNKPAAKDDPHAAGALAAFRDDVFLKADHALDNLLGSEERKPELAPAKAKGSDMAPAALLTQGNKQYLNFAASDIYNTKGAQAAFDRLFDRQQPAAVAA